MNVEPIGIVRSPVREGVDKDWGRVIAEIHLSGYLALGLAGLEQFSHIVVVFFMHQSSFDPKTDLVRRPQGRSDMPEIGIFAQRAKHRPNPIGVSAVKLISVRGNVLTVRDWMLLTGPRSWISNHIFPLLTGWRSLRSPNG